MPDITAPNILSILSTSIAYGVVPREADGGELTGLCPANQFLTMPAFQEIQQSTS
jgi:hypothetical protein